jgi:hypothetical protein
MKKLFVLIMALSFVAASAAVMSTIKPAHTEPTNAWWQIIDDGGDNVLACVMDGGEYGLGDDCRIYNTDTLDFTGVVGNLYLEFDVSLVNDSANDHCILQMRDSDDSSWTDIEDFTADTVGYEHRQYDLKGGAWGDWTAYDSVYVRFRWLSDATGTDPGIRINDLGFYEQGNAGVVEDFDDYDVGDGMDDIGWDEEVVGGTGHWLVDNMLNYGGTAPGSGNFISGDDDAIDLNYQTYAWSPEISDIQDPDVSVDFGYNYYGGSGDQAKFYVDVNGSYTQVAQYTDWTWGAFDVSYDLSSYLSVGDDLRLGWYYYTYPGYWEYWFAVDDVNLDIPVFEEYFYDDFEGDLSLWTVKDAAGNLNIEPSSLGTIKGMYH